MAEVKNVPVKVEQKKAETPVKVELKKIEISQNGGKPMNEILKDLKPVTAESRKRNAEQFVILSQKHGLLIDKKNQLDKFLIADDGMAGALLTVKMKDKSFDVSNNEVIKGLLLSAKVKLNSLIEITESEILNFII